MFTYYHFKMIARKSGNILIPLIAFARRFNSISIKIILLWALTSFFFMVFFTLLVCIISHLYADDKCTLKKGGYYNLSVITDCLESIPYDQETKELERVKETLLALYPSYSHYDAYLDLPHPYENESFDLETELKSLNTSNYTHIWPFYTKVRDIIARLRDGHTRFSIPCSNKFFFFWPYTLNFTSTGDAKADGSDITVILQQSDTNGATDFYHYNHTNLVGKIVTKIELDDIEAVENETPAMTVSRWANMKIFKCRNPACSLTDALTSHFSYRDLSLFDAPKGPIIITYLDNGKNVTEEIPFIA